MGNMYEAARSNQRGEMRPAPSDHSMAKPTPRIVSMQSRQASTLPTGSYEVLVQGPVFEYSYYFRSYARREGQPGCER